jgi:hypothetical protein
MTEPVFVKLSHRRENLRSYIELTGWALQQRSNVFPLRYELGLIPEDGILHSHRRENLKSHIFVTHIVVILK